MNRYEGLRHRLHQVEEKLDFVLKTVTVTLTFTNPLDPNAGKSTTVPLGALYDEIKRVQLIDVKENEDDSIIDAEITGHSAVGDEDSDIGDVGDDSATDSEPPNASPAHSSVSPSGIVITG